jgi:hypothetical protein
MPNEESAIKGIVAGYNDLIKGIDAEATNSKDRFYGGIIRAGKGKLVENIGKNLVEIAWRKLNQEESRLTMEGTHITIPIKKAYVDGLVDKELRDHIMANLTNYNYRYKPDILVQIDTTPVFEIECKSYTENAMIKRILVDDTLIKTIYPKMKFALLQLESQLGGDYSKLSKKTFGSKPTNTLLSYFDIDLTIITLLKDERDINKPIHRFFKPLEEESLKRAVDIIIKILEPYA